MCITWDEAVYLLQRVEEQLVDTLAAWWLARQAEIAKDTVIKVPSTVLAGCLST